MALSVEAVFVPGSVLGNGDPPRTGRLALRNVPDDEVNGEVELVLPVGRTVRRTRRPARLLPIPEALSRLLSPGGDPGGDSFHAWSAAALAGLGLIGRGRLLPAVTPEGIGTWRVGPLDPGDHAWLRELAAAMPAQAHAIPLAGTSPVRIRSGESLVREFWDALADTLVRTPAAPLTGVAPPFAEPEPLAVPGPPDWLTEAARTDQAGAKIVIRVQPTEPTAGLAAAPESEDPGAWRAVLQLRSVWDPSLLVDVADFWNSPAAVLARFGEQAESDLLLGLRRGARAWPPLAAVLDLATPTGLDLGDADLDDLLGEAAEALDSAGLEVLWPAELFGDGLTVKAGVSTPAPPGGAEPTFSLEDLLEFHWQPMLDGEPLTDEEIAALAEAKRPFIRLRGRWIKVDKATLEKLRKRPARKLKATEALAAALTGELEVDGEVAEFTATGPLADLATALSSAATAEHELEPPAELRAVLRPYQRRGFAWLAQLTATGLGACLADDMGLGKTLQLITLHLHRRELGHGPTLVICPATLLGTWQREIAKFAPTVPVRRYHGGDRHLDELAADEIVLTTYGVVRLDSAALGKAGWGLVAADEAQHAKNPLSRTARAIREVPATARVALTGTPVENRLSELWSILDWVTPGLLGPLQSFQHKLAVPVERYRDPDATRRLSRLTRPFLLRRRKSDPGIAPELPRKTESDLVVPLQAEQATLYQAVVDETLDKIRAAEGIERRGLVLSLLTALKQICNHPAQYLHENGPIPGRSGKLAALDELLDVLVDENESVLIFSQYVEMCRLLQTHLNERGVSTLFLHGGATVKKREQMVAGFQSGAARVFLLSLKAGGVGLTLTRATHVIHYDRWWNPAVEDQATDRAYRIGQDQPVQVHRMIAEGTVEDRIANLIAAKRELAESVIGAGESWITELADDELAELVQLGAPR